MRTPRIERRTIQQTVNRPIYTQDALIDHVRPFVSSTVGRLIYLPIRLPPSHPKLVHSQAIMRASSFSVNASKGSNRGDGEKPSPNCFLLCMGNVIDNIEKREKRKKVPGISSSLPLFPSFFSLVHFHHPCINKYILTVKEEEEGKREKRNRARNR